MDLYLFSLKTITVKPVFHRGAERLLVLFPYDADLIALIRNVEGSTFSSTYRSWHVPNNRETLKELFRIFKGAAFLDTTGIFGSRKEVGSRKSEVGSQKSGVGSQNAEFGSQKSGVGSQNAEVGSQKSGVGSQK